MFPFFCFFWGVFCVILSSEKRKVFIMKNIVSLAVLAALTVTVADAAPSHLTRTKDSGYQVTYNYTEKEKTGWYVGGRAELSFLNWKNKYYSDAPTTVADFSSDKYSFEPVFGGSLFAGHTFNYFWRAELEAGLIGQFSDKDMGIEFKMTVPYLVLNGYYDFANGMYLGAGLGMAMPKTELDYAGFETGGRSKRTVSPMGALMVGYVYKMDSNLSLDLRYRLAAFSGTKHSRVFSDFSSELEGYMFTNKIGLILDNSISVGIRYEF